MNVPRKKSTSDTNVTKDIALQSILNFFHLNSMSKFSSLAAQNKASLHCNLPLSLGDGLDLVSLCLGGQLHRRHQLLLLAPDLLLFNLDLLPALNHLKSDNDGRFPL